MLNFFLNISNVKKKIKKKFIPPKTFGTSLDDPGLEILTDKI